MERELWRRIVWGLKRLPRWSPRNAVYDNREVLAVLLWAALHDRSILWACQRAHWPVQAWRRRLPDQSTMSRRVRDPRIVDDLRTLLDLVQRGPVDPALMIDGKPLAVSEYSGDPDACTGWGAGRYARGYKLHVLIDAAQRLLAWELRPMNQAECVVAVDLLHQAARRGVLPTGATLRGDASYDSNRLHEVAGQLAVQLIAPRRKPYRSIGRSHRQHPGRLRSIELTEQDAMASAEHRRMRTKIERYLGTLATIGGGLFGLPSWARRTARVQVWVGAKLALHAAYRQHTGVSPNAVAA
jgi:DDE family transposase